ncbi:MAG: hypothetical protein MJZ16_13325, partial [Bacteroidales bacterium]|nr:hypothetical protein [Bacteroidales bacterium]
KMDYIYVFGVREKSVWDHTHIQTLFKGHSYWNDGLSLVPTGTPTNDIDGFRKVESPSEEEMIELKYKLEILEEGRNRKRNSDTVEMCEYLGISYEDSNFSRAINQDKEDLHDFYIAAQVLWSHFINKMFSDIMEPVAQGDDLVKYLAEFFQPYVNARGLFPVFRIGDQPYGIVPVTDFENLKFSISNLSGAYLRMFYDTALAIGKRWTEIKNYNPLCAETLKGSTSNKRFFEMMAQTPHSMSVSNRFYYTGDGPVKKNKEDIWLLDMLDKMGLYGAVPVKDSSVKYDISELVDSVKKALPHLDDWNAESLVYEFMDVFTYRIDAWYTAMVKYCLDKNIAITGRSNTPAIGCFGWVFDLEYGTRNKTDEKGEFILAPSVQHALTAAVLRSSYLQTKGDTLDSHMCINLSSMRARQALRMLDGIKSGMSTGLILGADLERYLHDAYKVQKREMDKYIYPLRRLFPQTVDIKAEDKRAEDYNLQVINGESLLNSILPKWDNKGKLSEWMKSHATELPWFNALVKESGMPTSDKLVLFNLIERILDSYDALNDLLLAEGVHRLVAGDKSSYAAISNFMSKGSGNLPSPAILDTPVEYVVVSQKV